MKFLITHVSYHAAIGFIKLLRKLNNIEIVGTSTIPYGYSSGSMLVDKFIFIENETDVTYVKKIKQIIREEKIDFIFTADENDMILFNMQSEYFNKYIKCPPVDTIQLFTDKLLGSKKIKEIGLHIPPILTFSEINKYANETKIILRERHSSCSQGIFITTADKRLELKPRLSEDNFIQKYISGREYTVDVFCDDKGNIKLIIPRERLAIRAGITYKCRIEKNESLIEACKIIYENNIIPGFSNVQFIIDEIGKIYFVELNPRMGGTTIASSICSINMAELYINFLQQENLKSFNYYMSKVKWNSIITRYYEETIFL